MRTAIRKHTRDFAFARRRSSSSALVVGGYILSSSASPARRGADLGSDFVDYKAEL